MKTIKMISAKGRKLHQLLSEFDGYTIRHLSSVKKDGVWQVDGVIQIREVV